MGPLAIRTCDYSEHTGSRPHLSLRVDPLLDLGVVDAGDVLMAPTETKQALDNLQAAVLQIASAGKIPVVLGGDHTVAMADITGLAEHFGYGRISVIHFDAHCDTWVDHFGEPSGHGTWVYEAISEGLVIKECFTQLGIRSAGQREAREYVRDQGGQIFTARELRGLDGAVQMQPVLSAIRSRLSRHGNPPVYLSLDIDCLDPAFAPGTGTPEPGGMTTTQVLTVLEELADLPFVGMDCVEVSPPYDHAELTSYAAASFVWTYLCGRLATQPAPSSS
jgi:agmatinase